MRVPMILGQHAVPRQELPMQTGLLPVGLDLVARLARRRPVELTISASDEALGNGRLDVGPPHRQPATMDAQLQQALALEPVGGTTERSRIRCRRAVGRYPSSAMVRAGDAVEYLPLSCTVTSAHDLT